MQKRERHAGSRLKEDERSKGHDTKRRLKCTAQPEDFQMACTPRIRAAHICTIKRLGGQAAPSASPFLSNSCLPLHFGNTTSQRDAATFMPGVPLTPCCGYCSAVLSTAESLDPTVCHRSWASFRCPSALMVGRTTSPSQSKLENK